jgi:chemotaxis protein CheZ
MPATALQTDPSEALRAAVRAETAEQFAALSRLVDRRIAELSAEVHGAVQLLDYSEANLSGQIARVHEQIASVTAAPSKEARNSGLELEAIIQVTETAANRIMEAAEAIDDWVRSGATDRGGLAGVTDKINAIFEACAFQDLTSQRVRRAIEHLERVEQMLGGMLPEGGQTAPPEPVAFTHHPSLGPDLAQDDIDALLA